MKYYCCIVESVTLEGDHSRVTLVVAGAEWPIHAKLPDAMGEHFLGAMVYSFSIYLLH